MTSGAPSSPAAPAVLLVPARFCGPPRSGNGGWTAGALAALLARATGTDPVGVPVTVTLRTPPPLDVPLPCDLDEATGTLTARHGDAVVGEALVAATAPRPVPGVPVADAAAAEAAYPGLRSHPFDTCFVCGTAREPGDGLRIFPGPVGGAGSSGEHGHHGEHGEHGEPHAAATWSPTEASGTDLATTWAALDCVGAWAADFGERLMVLGRITAQVHRLPVAGETLVVAGALRGQEGRRSHTAASLRDADGEVVAAAEHVWFAVDPALFR